MSAYVCGMTPDGVHVTPSGCLDPMVEDDRYRCTDCGAVFHRECARRHFVASGDRVLGVRDRILVSIDAVRIHSKTLGWQHADPLLNGIELEVLKL